MTKKKVTKKDIAAARAFAKAARGSGKQKKLRGASVGIYRLFYDNPSEELDALTVTVLIFGQGYTGLQRSAAQSSLRSLARRGFLQQVPKSKPKCFRIGKEKPEGFK